MTRIEAERLLARPGAEPTRYNVAFEIEAGRFAAIGKGDGGGKGLLALPPLANAHDHGRSNRTLAYGAPDDALEIWLTALRLEPLVDPYLRAVVAFARMAESGIAAANHCHNTQRPEALVEEAAAVAKAAADVGIRIAFAAPIMDRNPFVYGDSAVIAAAHAPEDWAIIQSWSRARVPTETQLARIDEIAAFESEWFKVQYGPVAPQWVQDATLERIAEASATTGRRVHMHLLETPLQREWADAHYPEGLVRHLDSLGLLSPRLTVAHGVWLNPDEMALLAQRGVTVSVNTSSNFRLKSGVAPVGRFLEQGLDFAIGLDGMAFDDDEDALRELRLAYWLHCGTALDTMLTPARLFEAALCCGHRSVGATGQGIAVGAVADLLLVDYATLARDVLLEEMPELPLLLARLTKRHVRTLIVGGRSVVEDGRVTGVDLPALEAALLDQARAGTGRMREMLPLVERHRSVVEGFYRAGRHREA